MRTLLLACSLVACGLVACSDDSTKPPTHDGIGPGTDAKTDGTTAGTMSWVKSTVDPEGAGMQSSVGTFGDKIRVAYFRELEGTVKILCPNSGAGGGSIEKDRPVQDLMFAQYDGSAWGTPVKIEQTVGPAYGTSMAVDKTSGKTFVGYLGGAMSQNECSSGDALIASTTDGTTFSKRTVSAAGPIGDTVGYWMGVALDSKGADHAAYGDVRFGYYEQDGKAKASARYDAGEAIVENTGAGVYNALAFDAKDTPVVAFFNPMQKGITGGIQLGVKTGGTWEFKQLTGGATSERLSLGTDGKGIFGLAYYDQGQQQIWYMESAKDNLKTDWQSQLVDTDLTHAGEFSSLAYDSKGNPGIAYYKCGKYQSSSCDPARNSAKFAWRLNNVWKTWDVDTGNGQLCGTYTSLAFTASDSPVISYRCVALNNVSGKFIATLKVAKGVLQ